MAYTKSAILPKSTRWFLRTLMMVSIILAVSACTQVAEAPTPDNGVIVVTAGSVAPSAVGGGTIRVLSTLGGASPSIGGSFTTPVSFAGTECTPADQEIPVTITYTLTGNQKSDASFEVHSVWTFDGDAFVGSVPETVDVPAKSGGGTESYTVDIVLRNDGLLGTGSRSINVVPFNLVTDTTDPEGLQLSLGSTSTATINVRFDDCAIPNTPPNLTLPPDMTVEATSPGGASVAFVVTAKDNEDDDATLTPICTLGDTAVTSGHQFPIGESEVKCSVTDSGGLSAEGSFFVYVHDTFAPVFTAFPLDTTEVATDINGLTLDLSAFTIAAMDYGPLGEDGVQVSPPVTITCTIGEDPADGYQIAIGQTATVSCVAEDSADYRAPVDGVPQPAEPNISSPSTFDVTVTLDVSSDCGFEPPLRMDSPYSAHKTNSTIPHKFCPPAYADGTPATNLADGLRLVLTMVDTLPATDAIEANDFAAGSTTWRYSDGHYIFNLKTARTWAAGQYDTTVSYNDIILASTELALRR